MNAAMVFRCYLAKDKRLNSQWHSAGLSTLFSHSSYQKFNQYNSNHIGADRIVPR